jgi:hypothetical protein
VTLRHRLLVLLALCASLFLPAPLLRTGAHTWIDPSSDAGPDLAASLDARLRRGVQSDGFGTGAPVIDGEWLLASYAFAAVGYAQVGARHPETREANIARANFAVEQLMLPEVRRFDTALWGDDMLSCLHQDAHDHVVLGYLALGLGGARLLDPNMPRAALHDEVIATLERRLARGQGALLETYPGRAWPVDNASMYAAIGLHARATGRPVPAAVSRRIARWETDFVDDDGLLIQSVRPDSGAPTDTVRGSGTSLAAWLMGFVAPDTAGRLARGTRDTLGDTFLGLGVVREYRPGVDGRGDVDSGPLVLGYSISGTGFALGAARQIGDRDWAAELWSTTRLFGVPWRRSGFLTGGPLGNALLLAFLTTPEPS